MPRVNQSLSFVSLSRSLYVKWINEIACEIALASLIRWMDPLLCVPIFIVWSSLFANLNMLFIIYLFTYSFIHFCSPPMHLILHGNGSCVNITIAILIRYIFYQNVQSLSHLCTKLNCLSSLLFDAFITISSLSLSLIPFGFITFINK